MLLSEQKYVRNKTGILWIIKILTWLKNSKLGPINRRWKSCLKLRSVNVQIRNSFYTLSILR